MFSFFNKKKVDEQLLEQLEEELLSTDMGLTSVLNIIKQIKKTRLNKDISFEELKQVTKEILYDDLKDYFKDHTINITKNPFVILVSGTNGGGKTTSIAKLTYYLKKLCPKILLVPCDTFRAGANAQLQLWSERLNVSFYNPETIKDPAAIAYKGVEMAIKQDYDLIIIDTSGRLDGNQNLMAELTKIENSIKKVYQSAPHESLLVIDGTQGQVALQQAMGFANNINLSGIIITKLDSNARGGILINIIKTLQIPIYFVGTGERETSLQAFNLNDYIDNLFNLKPQTNNLYASNQDINKPFNLEDVDLSKMNNDVEKLFGEPSSDLIEDIAEVENLKKDKKN